MTSMPAPIAVALSEYENENPSFRKLWRLVGVYEALLKYATVLAIQNFYDAQLKGRFPAVDSQICNRITRPLLSDWKDLLGKVLQCFAEREGDLFYRDLFLFHFRSFGQNSDLQKSFTDQGAAGKLLNLHNSLAHSATLPDDEAAARVKEYEKDLGTLLDRAAFFADLPLFSVETLEVAKRSWPKDVSRTSKGNCSSGHVGKVMRRVCYTRGPPLLPQLAYMQHKPR